MDQDDQRDYAEEASNRADMEREGLTELRAEWERGLLDGADAPGPTGDGWSAFSKRSMHAPNPHYRPGAHRLDCRRGAGVPATPRRRVMMSTLPGDNPQQKAGHDMGQPTPAEDQANGTVSAANTPDPDATYTGHVDVSDTEVEDFEPTSDVEAPNVEHVPYAEGDAPTSDTPIFDATPGSDATQDA